jgi:rhodanese-related sulfurtransferase
MGLLEWRGHRLLGDHQKGRDKMSEVREAGPIRISAKAARELYDDGGTTVLDVVDPGTFEELDHKIADAVRIDPLDVGEAFEQLPKEDTILAY